MNSEELELSLRTEFETYLKNVRAEMKREAAEFQDRIVSEVESQKAKFDDAFRDFTARFDDGADFDDAFRGSVAEHLRMARDEGARIAADATDQAIKMAQEALPAPKYDAIRDAIKDISTKDSQSSILKSLVAHAEQFAPRGAFFIIKSEHFVGWKVFGSAGDAAESAVREIHFPTSGDSILATAASSQEAVEGPTQAADAAFLDPLQFGEPGPSYAIPLVARHRAVAVLYADHGDQGDEVNREALETLVSVAGLTVELLASMQAAKAENRSVTADFEHAHHDGEEAAYSPAETAPPVASFEETPSDPDASFDETIADVPSSYPAFAAEPKVADFSFSESVTYEGGFPEGIVPQPTNDAAQRINEDPTGYADERQSEVGTGSAEPDESDREDPGFDTATTDPDLFREPRSTEGAFQFDSGGSIEPAAFESAPFDATPDASTLSRPAQSDIYAPAVSGIGFSGVPEPAAEPSAPPPRLSDRNVDLPIEVPDEERRIHNDARRFARLLVSEIKLYNEKKVLEGREAGDLYERLREAIDRSREMYDKRVQPPVAAKFDYFHYEIVNALAEGNAERLGSGYPGSTV